MTMPHKANPSIPTKTIGTHDPQIHYTTRTAVRTFIPSADIKTFLILFNQSGQYYKLPGGGIEENEDHAVAAARETLEETGCVVEIMGECMAIAGPYRLSLSFVLARILGPPRSGLS